MSLLIRGGIVLTMNDRFDIVEGDVSITDGRIAADRRRTSPSRHDRVDRRARRLRPARLHPDAHPSLPDALPRLRRRSAADGLAAPARLADGSGAHAGDAARRGAPGDDRAALQRHDRGADDGDGARHRRGVRGGRRERPARDDRQVHDGLRRAGAAAAAGGDARARSTRASRSASAGTARERAAARRVRAALRRVVLARAARGGRGAVGAAQRARAHARLGVARRDRDRPADVRRRGRTSSISRACASRRRTCAPRTACGWTSASSSCSPSTTSR